MPQLSLRGFDGSGYQPVRTGRGIAAPRPVAGRDELLAASLPVTLDETERRLAAVGAEPQEVVGRQGLPLERDHDMTRVAERGLRSYVSEPNRGRRKWKGKRDAQKATYDNRGRIRGERGERRLRKRGEKLERSSLPRRAPQSEFLGTFPKFLRFVANRLAAPSCFLLLLSSCSYFTVKGPPAYIPPNDPVPIGACTLESKAPIADGIVAGFFTFNLVESFWLSDDEVRDKRSVSKRFYIR